MVVPSTTIGVPFTNTRCTPVDSRQAPGAAGEVLDEVHLARADRLGVEQHDVGVGALAQHAPVAQSEQLGRRLGDEVH